MANLPCYPRPKSIYSSGVWLDESPVHSSLPLLLIQITFIVVFSRIIHSALRPLGQSTIVSQILTGFVLGPCFLGSFRFFKELYEPANIVNLKTVGTVGILYFQFLIGVKIDVGMLRKSGKNALAVSFGGHVIPVLAIALLRYLLSIGAITILMIRKSQIYNNAFQWSTSSIIVVASLLDEMNLLNSKIGRLAIAASLVETTVYTTVKAVAGLSFISRKVENYYTSVIVLSTNIAYILAVLYIARPITQWMVRKTPQGGQLSEEDFAFLIFMVLLFSIACIYIGIDISFSLFFLGLMLPSGPPVGSTLVDRLEGIVTNLYFPIYVAVIAIKFDFNLVMDYIKELKLAVFLDSITIIGKTIGVMAAAFFSARLSPRSIFALAFIMNTRGITELILVEKNYDWASIDPMFPTLSMVEVTAIAIIAAPLVKILYDPSKRYKGHTRRTMMQHYFNDNIELRVVSCIHRQENVPPTVNILESLCIDNENPFCIYLLHLRELVGRVTSVILPYKKIKSSPYGNPATDIVVNAFTAFEDRKNGNNYKGISNNNDDDNNIHIPGADCVTVQPYVNVAPYTSMYDDICDLAISKKASMVLVPFHRTIGFSGAIEEVSEDIRQVNLSVLKHSPCTVAILIDHGHNTDIDTALDNTIHNVVVYFLGGCDDRESLALAMRIGLNPRVGITVFHFKLKEDETKVDENEDILDNQMIEAFTVEFRNRNNMIYREEFVEDGEEMVDNIRMTSNAFDLIIVGRRQELSESALTEGMSAWSEFSELGIIGDMLASKDLDCQISTLVIQQAKKPGNGKDGNVLKEF